MKIPSKTESDRLLKEHIETNHFLENDKPYVPDDVALPEVVDPEGDEDAR